MTNPPPQIKKPGVKKSEALWLMTFSDLAFVLMCFFIMLLTFSEPKQDKYDAVAQGMSNKKPKKVATKKAKGPDNLKELEEALAKKIKKAKISARVKLGSDGVGIEFKDGMLFRAGSARSNLKFKKIVDDIIKVIAAAPKKYKIKIEGHTDDTPIRGKYRNNWELSAARGISLLKLLSRRGISEGRMTVVAHADTKPKIPVKGLKGAKLRKARATNRRVLIKIY